VSHLVHRVWPVDHAIHAHDEYGAGKESWISTIILYSTSPDA
jgi:hypothetical protein